jgi:hypothetical protein
MSMPFKKLSQNYRDQAPRCLGTQCKVECYKDLRVNIFSAYKMKAPRDLYINKTSLLIILLREYLFSTLRQHGLGTKATAFSSGFVILSQLPVYTRSTSTCLYKHSRFP